MAFGYPRGFRPEFAFFTVECCMIGRSFFGIELVTLPTTVHLSSMSLDGSAHTSGTAFAGAAATGHFLVNIMAIMRPWGSLDPHTCRRAFENIMATFLRDKNFPSPSCQSLLFSHSYSRGCTNACSMFNDRTW